MKKKMMSKMKRFALNASVIAGVILGLAACDNELNTIGSDILGADQLNDRIKKQDFDVVAFNEVLGPVQTNNFGSMPLGSYTDPVYGRTDYSFVSQLDLPTSNPSFGIDPVLDSVVINLPYFSTATDFDGEATTYEVDSLYGTEAITLQIYRNNFLLNDFDINDVTSQAVYYSDLGQVIDAQKGALILDHSFYPDSREVIIQSVDEDGEESEIERLSPRLRVQLDRTYWQNVIIDAAGTTGLSSNNNFRNYFRGLYFKVSSITGQGHLSLIDIENATVDFYLKINVQDVSDLDNDGDTDEVNIIDTEFTLSFGGNNVSLFDNSLRDNALTTIIQGADDSSLGEERLYLKGGSGSLVLIDLFGPDLDMNGEADALTEIIANQWIINDASLTFYVDQSAVNAGSTEPERIIIYNYDDNAVLVDYIFDQAADKSGHLGVLERLDIDDGSSQGVKYRVRLTDHITSVLNGDIENVRLAVAVTRNVNSISTSKVKNPNIVDEILTGSAISHEGTILHGNLSSDADKRLKLEIYYSETTN